MSQSSALSDSFVGYDERWGIFEHPIQDISTRRVHTEYYYPLNSDYSNHGVISFNLANSSSRYLDLQSLRLHITCNITGKNGEVVEPPLFNKSKEKRNADGDNERKTEEAESQSSDKKKLLRKL